MRTTTFRDHEHLILIFRPRPGFDKSCRYKSIPRSSSTQRTPNSFFALTFDTLALSLLLSLFLSRSLSLFTFLHSQTMFVQSQHSKLDARFVSVYNSQMLMCHMCEYRTNKFIIQKNGYGRVLRVVFELSDVFLEFSQRFQMK